MDRPRERESGDWRSAGSDFIRSEISGGLFLLAATIIALLWANLPPGSSYGDFWSTEVTLGLGEFSKTADLKYWVNDGLMVLFFFVIGLEIKRELVVGELSERSKALLPMVGAVGGVILPGIIFFAINAGGDGARGWAIPMATDIAFAVGVLALLGNRIPAGVRLTLLSIAIVDDIIAILIIALFYSGGIDVVALLTGCGGIALIILLRSLGVAAIWPYVPIGLIVWAGFLFSGVHATIAGVLLGLLTPAHPTAGRHVLESLEGRLTPITTIFVVPVFALANAGIVIDGGLITDAIRSPVFLGIVVGLVIGKLVGITGAIRTVERLDLAKTPDDVSRPYVTGIGALGGIGFTVSLFITELSFGDSELAEIAKLGIFGASLLAALLGLGILLRARRT